MMRDCSYTNSCFINKFQTLSELIFGTVFHERSAVIIVSRAMNLTLMQYGDRVLTQTQLMRISFRFMIQFNVPFKIISAYMRRIRKWGKNTENLEIKNNPGTPASRTWLV